MSLAQKVVGRPVFGIVVFGLVAIVALYLVSDVAIDMFPEIENPIVMVSTGYKGAGPETVEKTVSKLLESSLVNISGLKKLSSTSSEGSSMITLEFDYGANIDNKVNDIRDRLDRVKGRLPDEADIPMIRQFDPNSMPILRIGVSGARSQNELRAIAVDLIQNQLEQLDGVASTGVNGGRDRIVRVELSQNRLEAYGLTITGIAKTLAGQNVELGAGSIEEGSKNYSIRTTGEYKSVQDIAETVVARQNGFGIRMQDLGTIALSYPDESSTVYINGESGVYVSVTKQSGSNSVAVAKAVAAKLVSIEENLPLDVRLEITQDNTTQISDMINELFNSAVTGAALAMLILLLFLRNIKSTIIIGISIPFSILVTLLVMSISGITLNMLTMTGLILGVGMIVDSSIVILENIFKFRERGAKPSVSAILGTQEVLSSIVSSTLTTLCVFVPIFLFKNRLGMQGQLFQGLIITVGIALTSSLFIAIFLVPILSSKYFPLQTRTQKPLHNPLLIAVDRFLEGSIDALNRGYRRLLAGAINHRLLTLVLVIAAFAGCLLAVPKMNIVMMPPSNEDTVSLTIQLPLGTKYEDTKAVMLQLQEFAIEEIQGYKNIIVNVGSSGNYNGAGTNRGELSVRLDLDNPEADPSQTVQAKLRAHFNDFPSATINFRQSRSRAMAGGADIDIGLKYEDISSAMVFAREISALIKANIPELGEVSIDMNEGLPQVEVVVDRNRAYDMGLSISGIAAELAAAMNGTTATSFRYNGTEYDVI
ncbi:efflux RND transporter permease subunit, partial [Breznakiellaceae bacterium SP9]